MSQGVVLTSDNNRSSLVKRGRYLEYFTIGYNSLEGLIAVMAGLIAGAVSRLWDLDLTA